ncbi:MAG: biotin--[acetyl-CoA-carboxylase] ligase [Aquificaceae bacterium]|nr:biotin--[acetyl-CoA-carboxylase] ligase [Aquificaceae bacterium]MCS7307195.1 biotin--[acetyl-CoA-carboxylase] ligase [Aquificaceae bacterium]MDW8434477.1 biotin--[acetyl-CoA-carboxylase] ligase [Aquificaceae bacterium]
MFKSLIWLQEVGSTQDFVKEKDMPTETVVVANLQTRGRGRLGRSWHSSEGGLYFSFSLYCGFKDEDTLPLVMACAIADYLESIGFVPAIKWVNDLYLRGKKVCGVLVERLKDKLVVGIGINVNQNTFPEEIEATSLRIISGKTFDRVGMLLGLLNHIQESICRLSNHGFSAFRHEVERRLLFKDSEVILYTPEPVVGILQGVGLDGSLLLLTQDGLRSFRIGELSLRAL